jgi:hypothetical protein
MSTVNPELLVAELDECLAECFRRASNRAEHIRLTRLQGLFGQLKEELELGNDIVSSTADPLAS